MPNLHLLIHNVLSIISIILILGLSLFTYLNGRKNAINITTSLLLLTAAIFAASHTIGVNIADPLISRGILMCNLIIFFTAALQIHSALSLAGKNAKMKWFIACMYAAAVFLVVFFIFNPDLFLLPSVSKMYFPNYYEPGQLNIIRLVVLLILALPYSIYVLIKAKYEAKTPMEQNQYMYMAATVAVTYALLFIPNFLVYDIPVDPLWGMLFAPIMIIPFLYGAVQYEMLNVKIVAKQAFFFALAVCGVGGVITLFNYSNVWIQELLPSFPLWVTAFISAVLTVSLAIIIWKRLRKDDLLRYEFITTVTHKFRTPLTHIKWSTENLSQMPLPQEAAEQLGNIVTADAKLVELTDLLVSVSENEQKSFEYRLGKTNLSALIEEILSKTAQQAQLKQLKFVKAIASPLYVMCDANRLEFVLQTLIENAISYTRQGGEIAISAGLNEGNAVFSIKDSGIGISKTDLSLLFSKFYRGTNARLEDTEGMGVGLYMCKQIMAKHDGKIWAESEGEGKGSTFSFSLPAVQ